MAQWIFMISIMLLMACDRRNTKPPAPAPAAAVTHYPAALPPSVINYLQHVYPQWRVVEKSDYSKTWWSFYDTSYNPCWARTDINDDQLADYALWLKKGTQLRLAICTGEANRLFSHTIVIDTSDVFNEAAHNLSMGIAVAPPAQIDVVKPRIQSLILKPNGFALMELEERTRIYHWANESIQTFYMK
ncbi:hypothetical protein [Niastella populi]|uniref:Uncharacterized protein n=1 Tax=Niastella populi TaxID=550983 RepID=A0A1V9FV17_9BACT|nr:hypothetical protein [Niastella populi]OQP62161.1 hypothetical protein A4R26_17930 [Niastella populi]